MSEPKNGRSPRRKPATHVPKRGSRTKKRPSPENTSSKTKQSRAIAMLRSDGGASIAALVEAMGWQRHSVRGFLAGVVRKRLGLKLESTKVDGCRIYRIMRANGGDLESSRATWGS
jgi:hypothetical protein